MRTATALIGRVYRAEGSDLAGRVRAYVGLGANVGDAAGTIAAAIRVLATLPDARLGAVSRLYATRPVGVTDQPAFHNAVVALDVPRGPDPETGATALLIALKRLERSFGRQERERWGPRELDLDLLVFGRSQLAIARPPGGRSVDPANSRRLLIVPHPEAQQRLFVLAPLADIAPRLAPPGWGETVESAGRRREQVEGPDAVRPVARWDPERGWLPTA
jgi:2-amino-4-hydroxy-6-hydroxymethyldihydropteridine diphosphokinase